MEEPKVEIVKNFKFGDIVYTVMSWPEDKMRLMSAMKPEDEMIEPELVRGVFVKFAMDGPDAKCQVLWETDRAVDTLSSRRVHGSKAIAVHEAGLAAQDMAIKWENFAQAIEELIPPVNND